MKTRHGADYPPGLDELLTYARGVTGEEVTVGRYPVLDVASAWELRSMLEVTTPGVELAFEENGRHRTACMAHADGSWARACAEWLAPRKSTSAAPADCPANPSDRRALLRNVPVPKR